MPPVPRLILCCLLGLALVAAGAPAAQAPPPGQRPPPGQGRPPPPPRPGSPPPPEQQATAPAPVVITTLPVPAANDHAEPQPVAVDTTAPFRQRLDDARRQGQPSEIGAALVALAKERSRLQEYDQALPLLEQAIGLANQHQDDRLGREAAMAAAELYSQRGDHGMQQTWLAQANAYRDRIATRFAPPPLARPEAANPPAAGHSLPAPAAATAPGPEPPPPRRWPWLFLPLALLPLWLWARSHRKAEYLHEQTERLARHQRQLSKAHSALQEQAAQLRQAAVQDALTGAYTRPAFARQLEEVLMHAGHYGKPVALMVFDLDHFKDINDSHGHLAGDAALKFVAGVVRENLRSEDLFGRFGGDECLIGCADLDREQSLALAEKIRLTANARAGNEDPRMARLSLSIGIAHADPGTGYGLELLFSRADAALYAAKRGGRNCSVLEDTGTPAPPRDLHAPRSLAPSGV